MHDYSIDRHPKEKILFVLALIAITATPWVNEGVSRLASAVNLHLGWLKVPAVALPTFACFLLLYLAFDRYLWRVKWLRRFLLVPDLNGQWLCEGNTVLKNAKPFSYPWQATITITQSWSKILIFLKTAQSSSKSTAASIQCTQGVGYTLLYQYLNAPKPGESELSPHTGAAEIVISFEGDDGEGHYFTDQHRSTVGTMTLTRKTHE